MLTPVRETAGDTRGFVACERTVQAEKRAPGVVAAIMYVDCGVRGSLERKEHKQLIQLSMEESMPLCVLSDLPE